MPSSGISCSIAGLQGHNLSSVLLYLPGCSWSGSTIKHGQKRLPYSILCLASPMITPSTTSWFEPRDHFFTSQTLFTNFSVFASSSLNSAEFMSSCCITLPLSAFAFLQSVYSHQQNLCVIFWSCTVFFYFY